MDEPLSTDSYKGVRDFYPADWAKLQTIFTRIRTTLATWGYEEYNASPLERAELYEAKTSEEIVNEQTYTFVDRGDRRVTLRPEMTPTLARMVAGKRRELALPLRWFSIPNVFRYERPQKGRLREHYQLNVDFLGLPEGEADIEVIRVAADVLKAFGATDKDFVIRMSSRLLLTAACAAAGIQGDSVKQYIRLLDKKAKMTPEAFAAASLTISNTDPLTIISDPNAPEEVTREVKKLSERIKALKKQGVENVVFDASITRGFDYYTDTIFEVYDTNPANPRALFGGGRYDKLVALFGGNPIPAIGFGMGDVTLIDFLETHSLTPSTSEGKPQLYLGTPLQSDIPAAQDFANELRKTGGRVFVNLANRTLGDQVKDAVKRGIPYFAAYGSQEVTSEAVRVKTLATGEETLLPLSELATHIQGAK